MTEDVDGENKIQTADEPQTTQGERATKDANEADKA